MEKTILQDYVDACELIKDTEKDIRKLNQKRNAVIFKIQGNTFAGEEDSRLRHEEKLLEQRKAGAEQIKWQVEEWMMTLSARMQRIAEGLLRGEIVPGKEGPLTAAPILRPR